MPKLSLAQYISLTLATGFAIFLSVMFFLGFMFAGVTWFITGSSEQEDRVMASLLSFILGFFVQVFLMSVLFR